MYARAPPQFGNGTLRLTTRQTYQLHGVLKQDLKTVFSSVIKNMGTTLGACGDVNRNVLAPPAPFKVRAAPPILAPRQPMAGCPPALGCSSGWPGWAVRQSPGLQQPVTLSRATCRSLVSVEGSPPAPCLISLDFGTSS